MDGAGTVLVATLLATITAMVALWLVSLRLRDASIVDPFWGPGFVLVALVAFVFADGYGPRRVLVLALTAIWGVRLGAYLFARNRGKGEDFRYRAMRQRHGDRFPLVSLFTVFGLQGLLLWTVSLPVQIAQVPADPDRLTLLDGLGALLWAVGLAFESIGDLQLARFKADPANRGQVLDRGLWRYTRHPNYFGDAVLWWGLYLLAVAVGAWWTALGPALMTVLLVRVSGVALLEKDIADRRPAYRDYVRRTSAFVPLPPRGDGG